ncbi:hypothetical protein PoB_002865900 [Plakobranchus ocellatus]|uniref:Uncharacterized protein n=1 Tax=Plakobranchus ocellatus TaxID=259542 RepID=A0AAV4A6H0_9GAST|nr:hypothetical protein PoB_002865900 [Plakobranchus ocellatus]
MLSTAAAPELTTRDRRGAHCAHTPSSRHRRYCRLLHDWFHGPRIERYYTEPDHRDSIEFIASTKVLSRRKLPQQGDLRLLGLPSRKASGGDRTRNGRVLCRSQGRFDNRCGTNAPLSIGILNKIFSGESHRASHLV